MCDTIYEAKNGKGKVLYDGVSLDDLRAQIIKASEDDYTSAPDIVVIEVYQNGVDYYLSEKDVKAFNDSLEEVCDFSFWEDEDRKRYEKEGY